MHLQMFADPVTGEIATCRRTLLPEAFLDDLVRRCPGLLDSVRLKDLRPDLFPTDRILAELIVARDRIWGIAHPELEGKLTAHW